LKDYLIDDTINITWNIFNSFKIIKGIQCQKAVCKFRGRTYEAWFTKSIPYSLGPWKLGGLPGLVIEARDIKNEVIFGFTGIEELTNNSYMIELPKNPILLTKVEYKRLKEEIANDPMEYLHKMMPGVSYVPRGGVETVGSNPSFTQVNPSSDKQPQPQRKPFNQIEIEDN